jgi:N-acetylglucosaminyldiphosphoundecaprenol N-acetyl-beta-D-mannosaminyltransferase
VLTSVPLSPHGRPGTTRRIRSARQLAEVVPPAVLVETVKRERLRSERSARPLSVAVFKVEGGNQTDTMRVAWLVLQAARSSDVVGTLDASTVCAVLPDTNSAGADAFCAAVELDPAVNTVAFWWTHTPGRPADARAIDSDQLLPWFAAGLETAAPSRGVRSIASESHMRSTIRHEKSRADRSCRPLSAVVIHPSPDLSPPESLRAVHRLIQRKRRTDLLGWLEDRSLCLVLPDTDAAGAAKLVQQMSAAGPAARSAEIHAHPSPWFSQTSDAKVAPGSGRFDSVESVAEPTLKPSDRATVWPDKHELFGVEVSGTDYDETVRTVIAAAHRRESGLVTFLPVHGVVTAATDRSYRYHISAFDLVAPDGQPVRWALNWFHKLSMPDRVCGPEAMDRLCRRAAEEGIGVFFYGSTMQTLTRLQANLLANYPDLRIVGVESPPFRPLTEAENDQAAERINASGAGIVFIGLGCPRQDIFAFHNRHRIKAVQLCVGAAFDFHAGSLKRPPKWVQKWGLEWTFRMIQEPRRLWKRYLVTNTTFVVLIAKRVIFRR